MLDSSGFVRSSQTFAGIVAEAGTLEAMLKDLGAPKGALIVMDAGITTQANMLPAITATWSSAVNVNDSLTLIKRLAWPLPLATPCIAKKCYQKMAKKLAFIAIQKLAAQKSKP